MVVSRQVIAEFVKAIRGTAIEDLDTRKSVIANALSALQPNSVTYEEQVRGLFFAILHKEALAHPPNLQTPLGH